MEGFLAFICRLGGRLLRLTLQPGSQSSARDCRFRTAWNLEPAETGTNFRSDDRGCDDLRLLFSVPVVNAPGISLMVAGSILFWCGSCGPGETNSSSSWGCATTSFRAGMTS